MTHSRLGGGAGGASAPSDTPPTGTGSPLQPHFVQMERSHSTSGCAVWCPRSGVNLSDPHEGQRSGTPRTWRMTADMQMPMACSVVSTPASASYQFDALACV